MEYKRKLGYSVTYGTIVQLRHHASDKFMTQVSCPDSSMRCPALT